MTTAVIGTGGIGSVIARQLASGGGKDVYWWLERTGRFAQTIDSFPARQWPP